MLRTRLTTSARRTSVHRKAAKGLAIVAFAGGALALSSAGTGTPDDPYHDLPATITLTGVVRDFREMNTAHGHADFERTPTRGFAHYANQVNDLLDEDGKPVFHNTGRKVTTEYRDAQGRNRIQTKDYIQSRPGDVNGALETVDGGSLTTAANFRQWYREAPGINMSAPLSLTLVRQVGTNIYTFDDRTDPFYAPRGGFFPINYELFGNSGGSTPNQNFHFTYEIDTQFVYRRNNGQVFTFRGDDDVYVFIDGKMVIDLGGVHAAVEQTIDLDRLSWLVDGNTYDLKFFFAERHRTQSNFRMSTSITLQNAPLPVTDALFD
jgi:fibro-slime domain-containing protein